MKLFKYLFILLVSLSSFSISEGAKPTWSVSPSDFEFSMTVTAVLNMDGKVSKDENDFVGAFINGECRGAMSPGTYTTPEGYKIVFLQVYSNTIAGEEVTFKMYNSVDDKVFDAINVVVFENDKNEGTANTPFIITTNHKPTDISLSNNIINEGRTANSLVGRFTTTDPDANDTFIYSLVVGDGDDDNSNFYIKGDSLMSAVKFDFKVKDTYSVRVMTDDQKGETFSKSFTINISPDELLFESGNYISPNGDGINDAWEINHIVLYKEYEVTICSSSGQVIFQTVNYQNDWSGTYKGAKVPTGVYYYVVKNNGNKFTGSITLVNE